MIPTDPIRPGAALNDTNLREALAARLPALEAAAATGGKRDEEALANAIDTWSLLAAYPWQRLNYRYGRWQSEQTLWKALITLEIWGAGHWERCNESFQVLDPYTGKRLGEFYSQLHLRRYSWGGEPYKDPDVLVQPGGTLEFVGEPGAIGAYRPLGGGPDTIRFTWHPWLSYVTLRRGIAGLRTGTTDRLPPPYLFVDLDFLDKYRAWYIDEPEKPARKAPWSSDLPNYRPGGLPRFGRQPN